MLVLLLFPLIVTPLLWGFRSSRLNRILWITDIVLHLGVMICQLAKITFSWISFPFLSQYFAFDTLNIVFYMILSILITVVTPQMLALLRISHPLRQTGYIHALMLFVMAMDGALLSQHLALLWVFIELTTLASALLIMYERSKTALEATWKYIFICSIGIGLSFVGINLLLAANPDLESLFFIDIYQTASPFSILWLKLAFVFMLVGFGTKMGLAPVHFWLPDAHSEAPAPVSALLSGVLLNTALLGILRLFPLLDANQILSYGQNLLLIMGFLSLFISSVFMIKTRNYKRMLAYSSIENMGIIAIAFSMGEPGVYPGLLHVMTHSFTKGGLFLCAGLILNAYKNKQIDQVGSLLTFFPKLGGLWLIGFVSISGFPLFGSFISEWMLFKILIANQHPWLVVLFAGFLLVILFGMGRAWFQMAFAPASNPPVKYKLSGWSYLPIIALFGLSFILGIYHPQWLYAILNLGLK